MGKGCKGGGGGSFSYWQPSNPPPDYTSRFPKIKGMYSSCIRSPAINEDMRRLKNHVTNKREHFGVLKYKPKEGTHTYTTNSFEDVLSSIASVGSLQDEGNNQYKIEATLNRRIPVTVVGNSNATMQSGATSHIGFYGYRSYPESKYVLDRGFHGISTAYLNPPSRSPSPQLGLRSGGGSNDYYAPPPRFGSGGGLISYYAPQNNQYQNSYASSSSKNFDKKK
jgi:hypothetical protein